MKPPLTKEEREFLKQYATNEQLDFLTNYVKRGRRTKFLNMMADKKVTLVRSQDITLEDIEQDASGWFLEGYIDYGKGNRLGKCACNLPLRRVFTVKHEVTGKTIDYGENHLIQFLGIDNQILKDLIRNLTVIDLELDELLIKIKENRYGYELLERDFHGMDIPDDIQAHIDANVPLLDRQIDRLYRKLRQLEREFKQAEQEARLKTIEEEQQRVLEQLEREQRKMEKLVEQVRQQLSQDASKETIAYYLVLNGISSIVEICHILIEHFGADKTLSVGVLKRPRILPSILKFLLDQVDRGNLMIVEKIGVEDCLFQRNEEIVIELEHEEEFKQNNGDEEQLSLF
ncbi:MAG: hypothetical protein GX072_08780 [Lysinibacillus sp.]|nr:hypothetical protein [Lysinibacillus sp.]